jgi:hypothetical protein
VLFYYQEHQGCSPGIIFHLSALGASELHDDPSAFSAVHLDC